MFSNLLHSILKMSFLVYLLVFFTIPTSVSSTYSYGIIRNASILIPSDFNSGIDGFSLKVSNCTHCLCKAFRDPRVILFTCADYNSTNSISSDYTNFVCQFFYFTPSYDAVQRPMNGSNIYLMKNITFEKDDCCNTTLLVNRLKNTITESFTLNDKKFRFLVDGDNETIVSIRDGQIVKIDRTTLHITNETGLFDVKTVGYHNNIYYVGIDKQLYTYDTSFSGTSRTPFSSQSSTLTNIRFVEDKYMLVGTTEGVRIYNKSGDGSLTSLFQITQSGNKQIHGIGVVNSSAFYSGMEVSGSGEPIRLHVKDATDSWNLIGIDSVKVPRVFDILVDNCKRIWVLTRQTNKIHIYPPNMKPGDQAAEIQVKSNAFNLLILPNYTIVISHEESPFGLTRLKPSLNCRRPH